MKKRFKLSDIEDVVDPFAYGELLTHPANLELLQQSFNETQTKDKSWLHFINHNPHLFTPKQLEELKEKL